MYINSIERSLFTGYMSMDRPAGTRGGCPHPQDCDAATPIPNYLFLTLDFAGYSNAIQREFQFKLFVAFPKSPFYDDMFFPSSLPHPTATCQHSLRMSIQICQMLSYTTMEIVTTYDSARPENDTRMSGLEAYRLLNW